MNKKDDDQKQDQPSAKPAPSKPAPKQARWPGLGGNSGIKSAKAVHGRVQSGRGSARGR